MRTADDEARGPDGVAHSDGRACWALVGTGLLIKRGDRWWDEWAARADGAGAPGEMLLLREQSWTPCAAPVPPDPKADERP